MALFRMMADPNELSRINPETLLRAEKLADFKLFIRHYGIIYSELSKDYFLQLFFQCGLSERAKMALATAIFYNSHWSVNAEAGAIFSYFSYKITDETYQYTDEIRVFAIYCLLLFLGYYDPSKNLAQPIQEGLASVIPPSIIQTSAKKIYGLVEKTFTSREMGFQKKDREIQELIKPRQTYTHSKVVIKELITLLLKFFPTLSINLLTNREIIPRLNDKDWITSLIECAVDPPLSEKDHLELIQFLEVLLHSEIHQVRLSSYVTAWLLTNALKYIKQGTRDRASSVRKRCESILKDPERELKRRHRVKEKKLTQIARFMKQQPQTGSKIDHSPKSVYVFEITLGRVSRKIALQGSQTLDHLHNAIQSAFNWDDDHLYAFFMNNKRWSSTQAFYSPLADQEPNADRIKLYTLGLVPQKKFLYLFDFGTQHEFNILTKKITSKEKLPGPYPKLLKKKGATKQYLGY